MGIRRLVQNKIYSFRSNFVMRHPRISWYMTSFLISSGYFTLCTTGFIDVDMYNYATPTLSEAVSFYPINLGGSGKISLKCVGHLAKMSRRVQRSFSACLNSNIFPKHHCLGISLQHFIYRCQ